MAYRTNIREQMKMLPPIIDDYVSKQDPVRVYDAFVDALDFKKLGISLEPKAGADEYYPKDMMKLIIYGYSYGTRSSRKLERACHHNLSFIWLMGDLKPDYRTIARFRSQYKEQIKNVLKQSVELCMKMDLIEGNTLFIDGSKFRANASVNNTWTKKKCKKYLDKISKHIDQLLDECEQLDAQEDQKESMVKLKKEIHDKEQFVHKIKETMNKLQKVKKKSINSTDPECVNAKGRQGTHASYNAQITVDEKHGLIVQAQALSHSNDLNQLSEQVAQASENLHKKPQEVCADSGYHSPEDLKTIDQDIKLIVPTTRQASQEKNPESKKPFDKEQFRYDAQNDQYICPEGKPLKRMTKKPGGPKHRYYEYRANALVCRECIHFGICTTAQRGRRICRLVNEELKEHLEAIYKSSQGQEIYKLRKQKAEPPFGHFKRNLGAGQFLLRGKMGADAELSILSTCLNIARMITIIGVPNLLLKLYGG